MLDLTKKWAFRNASLVEVKGLRIADWSHYPIKNDADEWTAEGCYWHLGRPSPKDLVPLQYTSDQLSEKALAEIAEAAQIAYVPLGRPTVGYLTLPTDSDERKSVPLNEGLFKYFPAALAGVAAHSKKGNDKHNPGEPLHHARGKSSDHADCILRHIMDLNDLLAGYDRSVVAALDSSADSIRAEASALCWRALALSQELHERFGTPLAPGARLGCSDPKAASESQRDCRQRPSEVATSGAQAPQGRTP